MTIKNKTTLILTRFILVFLSVGYYVSVTTFYHSHFVNGEIITHSHPYKHDPLNKGPFENHKHTPLDYQFIQQMNESVWDNTEVQPLLPLPYGQYYDIVSIVAESQPVSLELQVLLLRAPPAA